MRRKGGLILGGVGSEGVWKGGVGIAGAFCIGGVTVREIVGGGEEGRRLYSEKVTSR